MSDTEKKLDEKFPEQIDAHQPRNPGSALHAVAKAVHTHIGRVVPRFSRRPDSVPENWVNYRNSGKWIPPKKAEEFDVFLGHVRVSLSPKKLCEAISVEGGKVKLIFKGGLEIYQAQYLTSLPEGIIVNGNFWVVGTELTSIPSDLVVGGSLKLHDCRGLKTVPVGITVGQDIDLNLCNGITSLPDNFFVNGNLNLSYCTSLTSLPRGLTVKGRLILDNCIGLTVLSEDFEAQGGLSLHGCDNVIALPQTIKSYRFLDVAKCRKLTALPDGLTIQQDLNIAYCSGLTSIPRDLRVGGHINIPGCPFDGAGKTLVQLVRMMREGSIKINNGGRAINVIMSHIDCFENAYALRGRDYYDIDPENVSDEIVMDVLLAMQVCVDEIRSETVRISQEGQGQPAKKTTQQLRSMRDQKLSLLKTLVPDTLLSAAAKTQKEVAQFLEL